MATKIRSKQLNSSYLTKLEDDHNPKLGAPLNGNGLEVKDLIFSEKILNKLTVTSSSVINWNNGSLQKKIMSGNEVLKFENAVLGSQLTLLVYHPTHEEDNYNLLFSDEESTKIVWLNLDTAPDISTQNKTYVFEFMCDENAYLAYYKGSY